LLRGAESLSQVDKRIRSSLRFLHLPVLPNDRTGSTAQPHCCVGLKLNTKIWA
jgi:hypothetical protein